MYNDMCFVLVSYACGYSVLAFLGTTILIGNLFITLKNMLESIRHIEMKNAREYTSSSINKFYEVASLLECMAVADVLDFVAPFNVWAIPNTPLVKYFLPHLAGHSQSKKILRAFVKFVFVETP